MIKCPVCKTRLKVKDWSDSVMTERYESCEEGCKQYHFEEWCGNYKTELGGTTLYETWSMSNTQFMRVQFIFKRKVARLRKAYRKGKFK